MKRFYRALLLLLPAAYSCTTDEVVQEQKNLVTVAYAQTQCADPWPRGADDALTAANIKNYLSGKGIPVATVVIRRTSDAATCLACNCASGKTVYVSVDNNANLLQQLAQLGFK